MIVYRVFAYDPAAPPGQPGHPGYLHKPQGRGRLDNPDRYDIWYFAALPEAAVGEVFGDLSVWTAEMFDVPYLPDGRRALGHFQLADSLDMLDLNDPKTLLDRNLRPTDIVARNRSATQQWALRIFSETRHDGSRRWAGVRWWSFHRPQWPVMALWVLPGGADPAEAVRVENLDLGHPAVLDAARTLARPIE